MSFFNGIAREVQAGSITCASRWAEKRRIMGKPIAGPYKFDRHPWCREMHDSTASKNVYYKAAQCGATEAGGINRAFYRLDILKESVLYVMPTRSNATDFSKSRFTPALAMSPYIKDMFTETNSESIKVAGSATLFLRGSRGDSNLKGIPCAEMILDEVDEMDMTQVFLADERLSGHDEIYISYISTPTVPGFGVDFLYQTTTKEHFFFKCPHCSRSIELRWPDSFELCGSSLGDPDVAKSHIKCYECNHKLDHATKQEWLKDGWWEVTNQNGNPDERGFHINQMYSMANAVRPEKFAEAYFRGLMFEAAADEFQKSKLGQAAITSGSKVDDEMITKAMVKQPYKSGKEVRPRDASKLITMGIDQGKWCYAEVCEWRIPRFQKNLNEVAVPRVLFAGTFNEQIEGDWKMLHEWMRYWNVTHAVLDIDPNRLEAERFRLAFKHHVTLNQWRTGVTGSQIKMTDEFGSFPVMTSHRAHWMDMGLSRFRSDPGRILLPTNISQQYRDHMMAPTRSYKKKKDGGYVMEYLTPHDKPDHFALCRSYNELALVRAASVQHNKDITSYL